MLPYGVIARTQEYFGGLPVLAEITHHQLIIATALASDSSLFFAGLLHDILKPLLNFEKGEKGWKWKHLFDVNTGDKATNIEETLTSSQLPTDVDIEQIVNIVKHHHDRDAELYNPIRYAESRNRFGLPLLESVLLPGKELNKMGLYICVEASGLKHPYHFFILNVLYQGIKNYLNSIYGNIFSKLGVDRLIVDYFYGTRREPEVRYQGNILSVLYFIPSETYAGIHVRHEYGSNLRFDVSIENNIVNFKFGWSDILTFIIPYVDKRGARYRIACVIPGSIKQNEDGTIEDNKNSMAEFMQLTRVEVDKVIQEIEKEFFHKSLYNVMILDYLEGGEQGSYTCIFCGKKVDKVVQLAKNRLLSDKFTDHHRINNVAGGTGLSVCPLCHVGFLLEERLRKKGPSFVLPLAAESIEVSLSHDFESQFLESPINISEGVVASILGLSTLQLLSGTWYTSFLKESNLISGLSWLRGHNIRGQGDVTDLYLKFLISRRVVLYPLEVKLRPRAIISSYGGRNKKFVLNTDILEGHVLWKGGENDLTEEQLDALEPLLEELDKTKIKHLKKIYTRVVNLYGLR